MLLGKSSYFEEKYRVDKTDARMALCGLYLMLLFPIFLIFTRVGLEISCGLMILLFLIHSWRTKDWRWLHKLPVLVSLAVWLYTALVATPLAQDSSASLGRVDWIRFIIFFAAIVYWLSDYREELRRIAVYSVVIMLMACGDTLYQFVTRISMLGTEYIGDRLSGPFQKLVIGIYLTKLTIPIIGYLLYDAARRRDFRIFSLFVVAGFVIFFTVLASNERTALIAFGLAIALVCVPAFFAVKKARLPILLVFSLLVAIVVTTYHTQGSMQRRVMYSIELAKDFKASPYWQMWTASSMMWEAHPVTGVGLNNFRKQCPDLFRAGHITYCSEHPHNLYMEWLAELGTVGFIGLLMMIAAFFHSAMRSREGAPREHLLAKSFACAGLLATFFPFAVTQSFFSNWPAFLAWYSLAWSLALVQNPRHD